MAKKDSEALPAEAPVTPVESVTAAAAPAPVVLSSAAAVARLVSKASAAKADRHEQLSGQFQDVLTLTVEARVRVVYRDISTSVREVVESWTLPELECGFTRTHLVTMDTPAATAAAPSA